MSINAGNSRGDALSRASRWRTVFDVDIGAPAKPFGGRIGDFAGFLLAVSCLLLVFFTSSLEAYAAEPSVGIVTRLENEAQVVSAGASAEALVGTVVHLNDELRTGADARLQVTFSDNTTLTLGEKAIVVINRYVYDPDAGSGEAALDATKGAIRFATGRLKALSQHTITVSTPAAAIGVRGTYFLADQKSVVVLEPSVEVSNQAGSVILSKIHQGTFITNATTAPSEPTIWTEAMIQEASKGTEFKASGEQKQKEKEPKNQNEPKNQKGGQNTTPNQQYATGLAVDAAAGTATFGAFLTSTLANDGQSSP